MVSISTNTKATHITTYWQALVQFLYILSGTSTRCESDLLSSKQWSFKYQKVGKWIFLVSIHISTSEKNGWKILDHFFFDNIVRVLIQLWGWSNQNLKAKEKVSVLSSWLQRLKPCLQYCNHHDYYCLIPHLHCPHSLLMAPHHHLLPQLLNPAALLVAGGRDK